MRYDKPVGLGVAADGRTSENVQSMRIPTHDTAHHFLDAAKKNLK